MTATGQPATDVTATGAPATEAAAPPHEPEPAPLRAGRVPVRLVASLVIVVLLAAASGLAFRRVFALGDILPVVAVASVPPVLLSTLISWPRRRTWPLWASVLATTAAWTLVAAFTLFHGDFTVIGGALRDSWKGILTSLLPAPGRPELLVLPHALGWLAGTAGAEIVLRSRTKAAAALPAIAVFGVALLLGVGGPGSDAPVVVALVGLAGALMIVRGGGRAAALLAGVPAAAVLGLLAAEAGPSLPMAGTPYDPRQTVKAPPPQQRDSISPLDRVSAWLQTPDQQMFTVRASTPEDWRLAVLDRFDGVTWTSGARFVPAGGRIPGDGRHRSTRVAQQVTVQDLPGVWVPAADRPRTLMGLSVIADPASGVLTAARPLHPGQSYAVTSMVRDYDPGELADAEPARDAEAQAATALPESPGSTAGDAQVPAFRKLAERVTDGADSGFARASALSDYLRTTERYDVTGLPGHTYAQLRYFLDSSHRGTSEQFATAFAVLARSIGLPARVVVGFRPGVGGDGIWQVRSGDVLVWPEVAFDRIGWVPFFPTPEQAGPSKKTDGVPAGETQQKLEQAQKNAAARKKAGGSGTNTPAPPPRRAAPPRPARPTPTRVYAAGAACAAALLYLLGVLVMPVVRRRRRRGRGTPAARIAGAWEQAIETLTAAGLPAAGPLTTGEVARFGDGAVAGAGAHLDPLADLVDRSRYSAAPPEPAAAEAAWRHTGQVARLARRATGRPRRLARRLHPRSLLPG